MKKLLVLLIMLPLLVFGQAQEENRGYKVKVGDKMPAMNLEMLNGERLTNDLLKGKVAVLQFTASWCVVCIKEMPHLEKEVWQAFKNDDFLLVGVDLKEDAEKVEKFAKRVGVTYPMALDIEGNVFESVTLPRAGVTRNIVLNREGEIIFLTRLYDEKEFAEMVKVIKKELQKS